MNATTENGGTMIRKSAAAVAAVLLLAGCGSQPSAEPITTPSATSASPTPSESLTGPIILTKAAAGKRYLAAICPANEAGEAVNAAAPDYPADDDLVGSKVRAAARRAAVADAAGAKMLADDGYVWPKNVRASIQNVALDMYESAATMKAVSRKGATYADWPESDGSLMTAASKVRLLLDLPPRNSGC